MTNQADAQNQNTIIQLKGNYQILDRLCELFESGELEKALGISILELEAFSLKKIIVLEEPKSNAKILDIYKNTITIQESAVIETSTAIESIKSEIVSLLIFWQNCLENQGFKTATLGNSISRKKVIELNQHLIELILTIDEINKKEIRIYLKVRPHNGKG